MITKKRCSHCKNEKLTNDFYIDRHSKDNHRCWCIECIKSFNFAPNLNLKEKYCNFCKKTKPINNFHKNRFHTSGYFSRCNECNITYNKHDTLKRRFYQWKSQAKRKCVLFNITVEYLQSLPLICHYTKRELTYEPKCKNTISLDRIDSSKGYTKDNIVFCCSDINFMKNDLNYNEFIENCKLVTANFRKMKWGLDKGPESCIMVAR